MWFCASVGEVAFEYGLLRHLRDSGIEADYRYTVRQRAYLSPRTLFARCWLRFKMYALHPLSHILRLLTGRGFQVLVVTTGPFFAPWLSTWLTRCPVVHLAYDAFPEALVFAGKLRAGSCSELGLSAVTRSTYRRCAATVFPGARVRRLMEGKYGPSERPLVIPPGAEGSPFRQFPPHRAPEGADLTILYCGILGRMHDTETVWRFFSEGTKPVLGSRRLNFAFHGNGTGYHRLRRDGKCVSVDGPSRVRFGPPLENGPWIEAMLAAQVGLVTLARGAEAIVVPSKVYSAMVAGQAVLAICPRQSDLADLVIGRDCGWVVEPGDVKGLRSAVREICADPDQLQGKRENAFRSGHTEFDVAVIAPQWASLLRSLDKAENGGHANAARFNRDECPVVEH